MNAVVEDYVDGIGAYVRGVHSEIASCLNMSPEQLDIVALNNMVQTQKKTQRVLVTTLDPKSTEPIRARSERHTLYGMIRTLRDINSLARLPQADILNAANTASYMDNELTGPYARKISVPIPLHLPIVVESKRRPRTIGSASSTASVYSLNDPPTSEIVNLGFDLPVSLKIRASMCSYAEQQENQNQQKKKNNNNNNNNNLSRPTTLPPPSPPPPLDDDNGDDDGDELMQVCGVRGASGRNSLYDENGCRLAGLTPFPLLMCDDTRFRNIVKPAGVIRSIEAIAHNLRSSSIKFSTIGLSGGSSSSSSQAATWLNNYVKNRKSSFGTREIPTVVAALCKDATALCSNVYIELGRMFSWMCDRKIISPSQSQTFSSAAYACRVTNTSGGGGGGGAPGGNILTRACKNNPDRLEILNVVFGAAELYGGMNYNLTETIDREYERDADMSTVMVGASLRLYVGTSARRLGRSVTGKTTTMTAASGDPAGGGGGGGIGGNGGGGDGDPSTATVDRGHMKMIRSSTTYLDTGMLPRRNKRRRRQTGEGEDEDEEEEGGGGGQHLHDGYMSSSQICRSAHKVRPVLRTTQTDTQTTAHVCEIVLPFVMSNYKSKRNSSVVYTKLQAGKPFNKSMLCANICGNGDFVKTAGAHDMTLLRRNMVHFPNGVYRPTRTNVRVQRVPVHQLACHNTLVELTQMVDTVDIDTTELARYVVQNMPIPNSYALCANVRTTYCAGTCK